jgi:peptidoglycan/LPS O-acetylase OafA/YrhL
VLPILPCLLGLFFGWAIWDRWLAQTATILVWGLFLLPFAAVSSIGGGPPGDKRYWFLFVSLFALSLLLTELGIRLRDRFVKPS